MSDRLDLDVAIAADTPEAPELCLELLVENAIPAALHGGLIRYFVDGIVPGSFLAAVLENDLTEAVLRANPEEHFLALPRLVSFLNSHTPANSHGSPLAVAAWSAARRLRRLEQLAASEASGFEVRA